MSSDPKSPSAPYPETIAQNIAGRTDHDPPDKNPNISPPAGDSVFIGNAPPMQALYATISKVAASDATVFITGESGTGKELCARALHQNSRRHHKPLIALNCAALPRDLMESELFGHVRGAFTGAVAERDGAAQLADGGTLFLDEIAEMAPDMQAKLLRFLQDFTFRKIGGNKTETTNIRIICATNRTPETEIAAGRLRADLYFRLHVLPLAMPPLRVRGDDICLLAHHFLEQYRITEHSAFQGFSEKAMRLLMRYDWPGNVRELQNTIRHITVMHDGEIITARMLPPAIRSAPDKHTDMPPDQAPPPIRPLHVMEREAIEQALSHYEGDIAAAAAALGIAPSTIYRKKASWGASDHKES